MKLRVTYVWTEPESRFTAGWTTKSGRWPAEDRYSPGVYPICPGKLQGRICPPNHHPIVIFFTLDKNCREKMQGWAEGGLSPALRNPTGGYCCCVVRAGCED